MATEDLVTTEPATGGGTQGAIAEQDIGDAAPATRNRPPAADLPLPQRAAQHPKAQQTAEGQDGVDGDPGWRDPQTDGRKGFRRAVRGCCLH